MNGEAHPSRKWLWTFGVIAALLLYVLSWGPVMAPGYFRLMFADSADPRPKWALKFYAPVEWLRREPSIEKISNRYWVWCLDTFYKDSFFPAPKPAPSGKSYFLTPPSRP